MSHSPPHPSNSSTLRPETPRHHHHHQSWLGAKSRPVSLVSQTTQQAGASRPKNKSHAHPSPPTFPMTAKRGIRSRSSAAVPVTQHHSKNTKPLSKRGPSLMHDEPDQELLALRNSLHTSRTFAMLLSTATYEPDQDLLALRNSLQTSRTVKRRMPTRSVAKTSATTAAFYASIRPFGVSKLAAAAAAAAAASSSSAGSVETLPISASSMSDDEPSFRATPTANEQQQGVVAATCINQTKKKKKSFKTWLKESLRHLDEEDFKSAENKKTGVDNGNNSNNRNLPDIGFYSNNHVMVNRERKLANLAPLHRSRYLDAMALSHALDLAENDTIGNDDDNHDHDTNNIRLAHSVETLPELRRLLSGRRNHEHDDDSFSLRREVGENVQCGASIRAMHEAAMQENCSSNGGNKRRRNILREAYTEFGMATALGKKDGQLYMVQLFRGPPTSTTTTATTATSGALPQTSQARRSTTTTTLTAFMQKQDKGHHHHHHKDDETIDI